MSKGNFNFAPSWIKVTWTLLIQVRLRIFSLTPLFSTCFHWSNLLKRFPSTWTKKIGFPIPELKKRFPYNRLTNGIMTPNCLLLDNQSETFLVQILIYKNRIVKRIIREDEKRNQEETQNCQRSIPSILPWGTVNNLQTSLGVSPWCNG